MPELIEPELSYRITGLCFQVQKELGRFCREKQYGDRLEQLLIGAKMDYQREFSLGNGNIVDFKIENKILVDLKAKPFVTKDDYFQMQRYLQTSSMKLGLVINFRTFYLKPKRVINTQ